MNVMALALSPLFHAISIYNFCHHTHWSTAIATAGTGTYHTYLKVQYGV